MLPCTAIAIANTGAVDSMTKVYLHVNSTAKWKLKLKARKSSFLRYTHHVPGKIECKAKATSALTEGCKKEPSLFATRGERKCVGLTLARMETEMNAYENSPRIVALSSDSRVMSSPGTL